MQYSFVLPADYDMAIVRRRIADKGHLLDDFPHLAFKAFLSAARDDDAVSSRDNLYAPFYLWRHEEGMHAFLGGGGFAALTDAFGWPSIRLWSVWHAQVSVDPARATIASRACRPIAPYTPLAALRERERRALDADLAAGALVAVSAYEPTTWQCVRFRLWPRVPVCADSEPGDETRQFYRVGHVSQPGIGALSTDAVSH